MTDTYPCYKIYVMRQNILRLIFMTALFVCGAKGVSSQERPKLREISDKKYEAALNGVAPYEKKGKCGYANSQGKFFIPAIFHKVRPMSDRHVGFVCFLDEAGREYWTPISLKGLYLTDLNFSHVVKDFDDRGLAVVRQDGKYGIISHTGKMVANCIYRYYDDKGLVYILYTEKGGCIAVAKDKSDKGYTIYSYAANEPIIVQTENGYGIVSPSNYFTVADFVYDSVKEIVSNEAYCLQKDSKKYLYVADKLSMGYEDVIPEQGGAYYVVKNNGKYGILTSKNEVLLSCSQDAIPVLKKNEYICLTENGSPVYLTVDKRVTASKYDDYLYNVKHRGAFAEYLLDSTLMPSSKKNILPSLQHLYGTMEFARVQHMPEAVEFADNLKLILLSKDDAPAQYLDVTTGWLKDAGDIIYHAFPSKTGAPAYASCIRNGKFGIIDIRNKNVILPFEYDKIRPLGKGYAALHQGDSCYLYSVADTLMITSGACADLLHYSIGGLDFICVDQGGKGNIYNQTSHRWVLPDGEKLVCVVPILAAKDSIADVAAFVKKGSKGALYSISSGDRLTDYLFDVVSQELFAEKYCLVTVGGKKGLYDLSAKKYVLSCLYDDIKEYYKYDGEELVVVVKAGKCGLHNLTKNKQVISVQNDEIIVKGDYASIRRGEKYAVQSLNNNQMVFNSPVEDLTLMDGGYALLRIPQLYGHGIYNLNWNEWTRDPDYRRVSYLGGDFVVVEECGLYNYKTNNRLIYNYVDLSTRAYEVVGDYFIEEDAVEGNSARVYRISNEDCVAETSWLTFLSSDVTQIPNRNFAILQDWEFYENNPVRLLHCTLFDLENEENVLRDSYDGNAFIEMNHLAYGLLQVVMSNDKTGLYDMVTKRWVSLLNGEISHEVKGGYVLLANGTKKYMFDQDSRVLLSMTDHFDISDCEDLKRVYDINISFDCDRISLMYEPK